jgi:hypothetical protein
VITSAGEPFETTCFPDAGGIITFSDVMANGCRIGIGHVGYEGFIGWPVILGCQHSSHQVEVTADGGAVRIAASDLRHACTQSELLRDLLLRFVQVFVRSAWKDHCLQPHPSRPGAALPVDVDGAGPDRERRDQRHA